MKNAAGRYWDSVSRQYHRQTRIAIDDFHYGPLIPGDSQLHLLPSRLSGMVCLEVGCGGAENSIFLAGRGAACTAVDISIRQLERGRVRAKAARVPMVFVQADICQLPFSSDCLFDLVHSAYALPFVEDQRHAIHAMAARLRPGGRLILSTAHPLANCEWLDVDGECGVLIKDYFHPGTDTRTSSGGGKASSRPTPISLLFGWLREAGLSVDVLLEPLPLPVQGLSRKEISAIVPYWSEDWLDACAELSKIPFTLIISASRPVLPHTPEKMSRQGDPFALNDSPLTAQLPEAATQNRKIHHGKH